MHTRLFILRPLAVMFVVMLMTKAELAGGSKILAVTPMVSPSHGIWNRCLLEALAEKGHQVTVLSPFSAQNKTGISFYNIGGHFDASVTLSFAQLGVKEQTDKIWQRAFEISRVQVKSDVVKRFLVDREHRFDLIILEMHYSESFLSMLTGFGVPIVAINAFGDGQWNWQMIGAENYPSVFAQPVFSFSTPMKFLDRFINFICLYYEKYLYNEYLKKQQSLANEVFGSIAEKIEEAVKKIDFFLMNSGPQGFDLARILPPNAKEVGCLQCRSSNVANLQVSVRDFVDSAEEGFIYMSLGTNVKSRPASQRNN
ncbi:uncharacterized protein LOC135934579 [Cloeon dipterum]|uniref:uncharacterized protein LOC135934579 n=1 Tax=Cloeon dipterum TaxID=197152 RepID=UPI00321F8E14